MCHRFTADRNYTPVNAKPIGKSVVCTRGPQYPRKADTHPPQTPLKSTTWEGGLRVPFCLQWRERRRGDRRSRRGIGKQFTASAWRQARSRLPLAVIQGMLGRVCQAALPLTRANGTITVMLAPARRTVS